MGKALMPPAKKIAAFGASKMLVAEFKSMRTAADMCNVDIGNISKACSGKLAVCKGYYWRTIPSDIELVEDDFNNNTFTVSDFDQMSGNEGRTYPDFKSINKNKSGRKKQKNTKSIS